MIHVVIYIENSNEQDSAKLIDIVEVYLIINYFSLFWMNV